MNIPIELSYTYDQGSHQSTVWRDSDKHNRYWFKFPDELRTSTVKERLVGFRSLWIAKSKRRSLLTYEFKKPEGERWASDGYDIWKEFDDVNEKYIDMSSWIDIKEDWLKFYNRLHHLLGLEFGEDNTENTLIFDWSVTKVREGGSAGMHWSIDGKKGSRDAFALMFHLGTKFNRNVSFRIILDSSDVRYIFNTMIPENDSTIYCDYPDEPPYGQYVEFYDVWDRHSHFLKSDLSVSTYDSYLGYTQKDYTPLKYYKITSDFNRFYVDLFNGHNHSLPSMIPFDNKDHLTLEMVLLQDARLLYT